MTEVEPLVVVHVQETELPGVGIRHDFVVRDGNRIGVIFHRAGHRELFVCPSQDPDSPSESIVLTKEESSALAQLLGGPSVVERLAELQQDVEGLAIDWVAMPQGSPYAGKTIGDTTARRRTGVSIVAVLREGTAVPAPGPEEGLRAGDTLLVVGTPEGIKRLVEILSSG